MERAFGCQPPPWGDTLTSCRPHAYGGTKAGGGSGTFRRLSLGDRQGSEGPRIDQPRGRSGLAERRDGLARPLLTIHDASGSPTQTAIIATMRAPAYDVFLKGSNHNSVTDLGLLGAPEERATAARQL